MRASSVDAGRAAYRERSWAEAYRLLAAADGEADLGADDLHLLANAAYLSGRTDECVAAMARAHQAHAQSGDLDRAAGCAYWLAFALLNRGEHAQASGWIARATEMLDDGGVDCVERGYLSIMRGIQALMGGQPAEALTIIDGVVAIAQRFDDDDLRGLSGLGKGQALIALDRTEEGLAILDQVMVAATAGELSEITAGLAYCAIIATCQSILDVRRASEWTAALTRWCADQPDLVPYSGHCLVHRSEISQLEGDWEASADAARAAHVRYAMAGDWASDGLAYYRDGELARLRGDLQTAGEAFREASRRGHDPQPGATLLALAEGRVDDAMASVNRLLREPLDRLRRARVLAVAVEVSLAAGDVDGARQSADELVESSEHFAPSMLRALAVAARGSVALADGDPGGALPLLRESAGLWRDLDAPYELARTRELIGSACRALGDVAAAELDLQSAAETYERLGATPDLLRVREQAAPGKGEGGALPGGLTAREGEVLRLVASGKTNRAIAAELVLSEKTVARHVSNIFVKLGLASRAAATAYAYQHDLMPRS